MARGAAPECRAAEPAAVHGLPVERGPRIRRGDRDLDRVRVELARVPDRLLDRLTRLAGQPQDEGAVRRDAEVVAVPREPPRHVQAEAPLDIVQDPPAAPLAA